MDAVNPLFVSIAFFIAAALKLWKGQGEQAFSRVFIALWYGYVYFAPVVDIEAQRLVGRWAITQLAVIEILSYVLRAWFAKKYSDAIKK